MRVFSSQTAEPEIDLRPSVPLRSAEIISATRRYGLQGLQEPRAVGAAPQSLCSPASSRLSWAPGPHLRPPKRVGRRQAVLVTDTP